MAWDVTISAFLKLKLRTKQCSIYIWNRISDVTYKSKYCKQFSILYEWISVITYDLPAEYYNCKIVSSF